VNKGYPGRKAQRATKVARARKGRKAPRANKGRRDRPVPAVCQVHLGPPEACTRSGKTTVATPPAIATLPAAQAKSWFL
jgi:hypothetical protein